MQREVSSSAACPPSRFFVGYLCASVLLILLATVLTGLILYIWLGRAPTADWVYWSPLVYSGSIPAFYFWMRGALRVQERSPKRFILAGALASITGPIGLGLILMLVYSAIEGEHIIFLMFYYGLIFLPMFLLILVPPGCIAGLTFWWIVERKVGSAA